MVLQIINRQITNNNQERREREWLDILSCQFQPYIPQSIHLQNIDHDILWDKDFKVHGYKTWQC
jgi:hypothetical protein